MSRSQAFLSDDDHSYNASAVLLPRETDESSFSGALPLTGGHKYGNVTEDQLNTLFEKVTSQTNIALPDGGYLPHASRPNWLKTTMHNGFCKSLLIYFCFYISSLGTFFFWFSLNGTVFYWQQLYTKEILLYMTAAYSSPAIFIQLLQARFDYLMDKRFGRLLTFRVRMATLLVLIAAGSVVVPFLAKSAPDLAIFLALVFVTGMCSSAGYGTLFQLVTLYPKTATSFLSLGYASPAVFLLVISRLVFGSNPSVKNENTFHIFFGTVTAIVIIGLLTFELLLWLSSSQLKDAPYKSIVREVAKASLNTIPESGALSADTPNNLEILKIMWRSALGIVLLMISRVAVYTNLTHVPSEETGYEDRIFSQRLIYINLGGDLGGRFLTVILPRLPDRWASTVVLSMILAQFSTVSIALVYMFGEGMMPLSNIGAEVFVTIFAVLTGYLQTQSYAYAAVGVNDNFRTQVGALMNVSTQVGNFLGIGLSFACYFAFCI